MVTSEHVIIPRTENTIKCKWDIMLHCSQHKASY